MSDWILCVIVQALKEKIPKERKLTNEGAWFASSNIFCSIVAGESAFSAIESFDPDEIFSE